MQCSRCGAGVQPGWKACPACGLPLSPTTPVQALLSDDVSEMDLIREALEGEFELLEELGRGGMAIVFRARERQLDREVAVKVLPLSLAFDGEFVERFEREARTAARLEHPNIIPIYRVGKAGRVSYFTMKLLRGSSLSNLLAERGRLAPAEIRRLLLEAAGALGYAAERGIVHRDVKPDNFMFDDHGALVITDFGIAKAASGRKLTGTGMSIGTPHYMSPEQARAQDLDGRSDIYSLGIVAYQCITGMVPFDGEDSFAIGYKHIMEPIPLPDLITADERSLFAIIERMMAKDPSERFQSCQQLIEDLATLPGGPVPAGASGSRVRVPPTITTQPTTPLPSLGMRTPSGTAPSITPTRSRRPVATRSAHRREPRGRKGWLFSLLLVMAAGGTGAAYYYRVGPFAGLAPGFPLPDASRDSSGSAPPALPLPAQDTAGLANPLDSSIILTAGDSTPPDTPSDTTAAPSPPVAVPNARPPEARPSPPSRDSGAIRIRGLPAGSTVLIDGEPAVSALTRLPVGVHAIAITAPRHSFFTDSVEIRLEEIVDYQPNLTAVGDPARRGRRAEIVRQLANCDEPGPRYNPRNVCFDVRPRAVGPTFVTVPSSWAILPNPSQLLVKVSAQGRTLEVRPLRPSNDPEFERMARSFAAGVTWRPAEKNDKPVTAWTPWQFVPVKQ